MNSSHWIAAILISALSFPLLVWWGLWLVFAVVSWLRPGRCPAVSHQTRSIVIDILIPAHNEEILLPRLLESLRLQTGISSQCIGRTLVIADHCTDRTASIAASYGVEVLPRNSGPRGKPSALQDGLQLLSASQVPDASCADHAILILDADCTASDNLLAETHAALAGASVTQAAYVLDGTTSPGQPLHAAAQIAFALKNLIRPRGMARLGIPCQLFGTGMCFRAEILTRFHFQNHLTEDLALSYDLLLAGVTTKFLPRAFVHSPLPDGSPAMSTQKLRWESGQFQTWLGLGNLNNAKTPALPLPPAMLLQLLRRGWLHSAIAVIDWSAPPVAFTFLYWIGVAFAGVVLVGLHVSSIWTMAIPLAAIACLAGYVGIGGLQISGTAGVCRLLLCLPRFLLWKIGLYVRMLLGRGPIAWQRTPRSPEVTRT